MKGTSIVANVGGKLLQRAPLRHRIAAMLVIPAPLGDLYMMLQSIAWHFNRMLREWHVSGSAVLAGGFAGPAHRRVLSRSVRIWGLVS